MLHDLTTHTILHGNRHCFVCEIEIAISISYNTIVKIYIMQPIIVRISLF